MTITTNTKSMTDTTMKKSTAKHARLLLAALRVRCLPMVLP